MYVYFYPRRRRARPLQGLGAVLSAQQVFDLARVAGFPPATARQMVAIAQRESSLNSDPGVGTISPLETSYGLWQINWKDRGNRALLQANGISAPEQLLDPATNARAAALLWAGNDANLNTAWYINRYGLQYSPAEKYAANLARLPGVDEFENSFVGGSPEDSGSVENDGAGALDLAGFSVDLSNPWILGGLAVGVAFVLSEAIGGGRR